MYAKYEASISYGSKGIANVKVDNRQTNRFQSQNASAKQKPLPQFLFSDPPKNKLVKDIKNLLVVKFRQTVHWLKQDSFHTRCVPSLWKYL